MNGWEAIDKIHDRHCKTAIELAELRAQETRDRAIENSLKSVAEVANKMIDNGYAKEAGDMMSGTIRQLNGSSNKSLNGSREPKRIYYLEE